jgi:hypothetical protein
MPALATAAAPMHVGLSITMSSSNQLLGQKQQVGYTPDATPSFVCN